MPHAPEDFRLSGTPGAPDSLDRPDLTGPPDLTGTPRQGTAPVAPAAASSPRNTTAIPDAPAAALASFHYDTDNPVRDYITALLGSPFGRQVTHHRALPAREAAHAPN
ncbi:hypothetical protein FVW20_13805, partial [Desulfovibrio oxamicus]